MKDKRPELSIVVPCYNEEEALPLFVEAVTEIVGGMGVSWELVLVDDGSSDGTLKLMRRLSAERENIRYVSFSRNFGKEAGIFAGLKHSRGAYVALMDADMQDPPAYLPQMYEILQQGEYDNVATRRSTREGEPVIRSVFSRAFYRIVNRLTDTPVMDGARDFRMMKRRPERKNQNKIVSTFYFRS